MFPNLDFGEKQIDVLLGGNTNLYLCICFGICSVTIFFCVQLSMFCWVETAIGEATPFQRQECKKSWLLKTGMCSKQIFFHWGLDQRKAEAELRRQSPRTQCQADSLPYFHWGLDQSTITRIIHLRPMGNGIRGTLRLNSGCFSADSSSPTERKTEAHLRRQSPHAQCASRWHR